MRPVSRPDPTNAINIRSIPTPPNPHAPHPTLTITPIRHPYHRLPHAVIPTHTIIPTQAVILTLSAAEGEERRHWPLLLPLHLLLLLLLHFHLSPSFRRGVILSRRRRTPRVIAPPRPIDPFPPPSLVAFAVAVALALALALAFAFALALHLPLHLHLSPSFRRGVILSRSRRTPRVNAPPKPIDPFPPPSLVAVVVAVARTLALALALALALVTFFQKGCHPEPQAKDPGGQRPTQTHRPFSTTKPSGPCCCLCT